jgi:membrane fusion protein
MLKEELSFSRPISRRQDMASGKSDIAIQPVIRREVVQRRSNAWLGEVRVATSLPLRIPLMAGLLFVACGVGLAVVSPNRERVPVSGELRPDAGVISVDVDIPGTIVAARVVEGETVEAGQELLVLRSPRDIGNGNSIELIEKEFERRTQDLKNALATLDERERRIRVESAAEIRSLDGELHALAAEAAINLKKAEIAQDVLSRVLRLRQEGLVSAVELSRVEAEVLSAQQAELNRQRTALSTGRLRNAATHSLSARLAEIEDRRAQVAKELSAVRQEQTDLRSRSERVIRSPVSGQVSALLVHVGQSVGAGSELLKVTPSGAELEAVLLVPSQAVAALAEGTELMLRIEAYPYQRFGFVHANVSHISGTTLVGAGERPAYRVRAKLGAQTLLRNGQSYALLSGMKVDSTVIVDNGSASTTLLGTLRHHLSEVTGG